ncbi:MAG: M48 family metallopeptidase [Candidatus Levybacteria bacterium]|nr:M48 family metallopeptidase [Candidatus Levybacteria bacterium]
MTIYNSIGSNKRKTWLMMAFFMLFFFAVSYFLGRSMGYGTSFVGIVLIISGLMSFASYYYSDKIVLSMSGAKPADLHTHRELLDIVENLSIGSGLPVPKVYVIHDAALNAFATGRDPKHAAIAATTGILDALSRSELEGVIGHEMSHVKNYDTRLMGVVSILAGSLAILSDFFMRSLWFGGGRDDDNRGSNNAIFMIIGIAAAILAPIAAMLIQMAISRRREFLADADGALLTRYPEGLARALEKIAADRHVLKTATNATAHLFIENPFKADTGRRTKSFLAGLFSTHPPVEERIKILRSM